MGRGRPVPRRGRPPKDAASAQRLAQLRKPKYLYSGQKQQQGKSSTSSTHNTPRSRSKKKQPWEGESDEEDYTSASFSRISRSAYFEDADDEEDKSLLSFADDGKSGQWDEEDDMEEDGDDDDTTGSPSAPLTALDSKLKMGRFLRARSPPRFEEDKLAHMPPLNLPESSADLLLPPHLSSKYLLKILSVYEVLNQFKFQLRLSAFRLEDFISSLLLNENNALLSEIHICLLKTLIREDEANQTLFGSQDVKDSIGIYLYHCDPLTWPTTLRMYIISRRREETPDTKAIINLLIQNKQYEEYPINVPFQHKVEVLSFLCDTFLETNVARDEILNGEGGVRHDDHCRRCHKLGDLLCCDRCSSVWHLGCLEPPIKEVPEDEWVCSICKQMAKETGYANEDGTIASFGDDEGLFLRRYILGWDRHGNKYWWLCRRLIIEYNNEDHESNENGEKEDKCIYISTKKRFMELMKSLDKDEFEKDLYTVLNEIKDEIFKAMERTEKMTKDALKTTGMTRAMKTWIEFENEVSETAVKEEITEKMEDKSAANSTGEGIMTRLKTGSLKEKGSGSDNGKDDDKEMIMVFDEALDANFLHRMSRKDAVARGLFFKLGMETRSYTNIFSLNMLALNKHQLGDERDKKRHLSHKFSLTPLSEFKWQGSVYGSVKNTIVQTLRQTLVQFENQLAAPFMHPNWSLHRQNWLKAVSMCNQPKDFTLALSILEASMKPVLFNPVWNESLGHTLLDRNTNQEREDRKKDEKRERREFMEEQEMIIRTTGGVKYAIMPHRGLQLEKAGNIWFGFGTQSGSIGFGTTGGVGEGGGRGVQALWKQRGEEYRVSGSGGWMFVSIARTPVLSSSTTDVERVDELEIPEEYAGELISVSFIDVGDDLRKEREDRLYYRKYRPLKNKRKGTKCIESFLDRRILLEEAILQQKLKAEEDDRLKPEDVDEDDYETKCYSPLCRTTGIGAYDSLCYCISCRKRQKAKRIKLEEEKKDREEREIRYKIAKEEQEKGGLQDTIADCKDKVYLNRVEKKLVKEGETEETKFTIFKTSGKRILGKGQLPPCNRFTTLKGKKKSIFVLPKHELRRLSRNANHREVAGFSYAGKFNKYLWPYGISPRPLFRYCWLWRNTLPQGYLNLNLVAAQLRTIWSCIKWDDMQVKPPPSGNNTITNENEVTTTELLKRRDLAPFGIRSEYLVRKIIVPLVNDEPMDDKDTPYGPGRAEESYNRAGRRIREGLRERKKKVDEEEERRRRGPSVTESWVGEEELELWEIKMFGERLERQQQMKETEKRKQIEESLKKQREEAQAKRFKTLGGTPTTGKVTSLISGPKRIFNSRTPSLTPSLTSTTSITAASPQLVTQTQQFAVIKTNSGQTFKVPASALQGKTVGQTIIIKQGGNLAASTTATIISTGTPPTVTSSLTPTITPTTPRPVVTPGSTVTLSNLGGIRLRTVGQTPTVRPLILSGTTTTTATTITTPGQATPTNNGQRIQIIKPVVGGTTSQTLKTVTNTNITINASNLASAITTTPNAAGGSPQQMIQIPIRFADNRMQIIQIPLSMFSSSQPIQISIPSSVTQQTTQTVTVTTTPQPATTVAGTSGTPQAIKIITNTNTPNSSTATSTTTNPTTTPNATRFITLKTNPQPTATPAAGTSISLTSTSNTSKSTNISEQLKSGSIQLKLNQSPSTGTITSTGATSTSVTPLPTTIRLTPAQTTQSSTSTTLVSTVATTTATTTTSTTTIISSPTKTSTLVRPAFQSPVGTRILVQQQPNNTTTTIHKVTAPSLKLITPTSDDNKSLTDSANKPFVLTQEIQDRIVRQALLNTNPSTSPEVQQKLLAWQKKQQQPGQVVVTPAVIDSTGTGRTLTPAGTRSKGTKRTRGISTTTTITPTTVPAVSLTGDEEENRRLLDCQQVLIGILDKIDKEEKMELRRKKAKENQFQSKWKSLLTKKSDSLNAATETLKRDIARKKSLMKEKLRKEIQAEITKESPVKKKETTPNNKVNSNGAANSVSSVSSLSNNTSSSNEGTPKRRKLSDSSCEVSRPPLNKIRIKITPLNPKGSTGDSNATNTATVGNKSKKLYCICKTSYDSSRFMVGCDSCHNWFHTDCLGLDEETVKKKKSWICNDCRDSDEENDNEEDDESLSESSENEDEISQSDHSQLQLQPQLTPQLSPVQPKLELPKLTSPPCPQQQQQQMKLQSPTTGPPPLLLAAPQHLQKSPTTTTITQPQLQPKIEPSTAESKLTKPEVKIMKTPKRQPVKKEVKSTGKKSMKKEKNPEEEETDGNLYCMCRQPYDESLFYIQCDSCQDWLHGKCVGIVSKEAQALDTYNCPRCAPSSLINYCNQKKLDAKDFAALKGLMKELKGFRSAWPFLKPVDATVVTDYYNIIKKPMDLATMDRKLESSAYATLAQFIGDLTLICDNCRYYNNNKSTFTTCANLLESFFLQKIKNFRQIMLMNK